MISWIKGNWGLRMLALILAIVIYHVLKDESFKSEIKHDRHFLKQR